MSTFYVPFYSGEIELCANEKCLIKNEHEIGEPLPRKFNTWCGEEWSKYNLEDKIRNAEDFWENQGNKEKYIININFPGSRALSSVSLALLLLPFVKKESLLYTNICITGDFERYSNEYKTKGIDCVKGKFEIAAKDFKESHSNNETFAFIYISNKDEIDEQLIKKYPWMHVKRFAEGISVFDVINYLQTGFCYPAPKSNQFMDAVYQKIYGYLDSDSYSSADITIYTSGSDNSECVYDRRLCLNYQRFLQQNKMLSLNINCTKSLDLYDLVSDAIVQNTEAAKKLKPIWQQQLEQHNSEYIESTIEILNRIHSDIEKDILDIKRNVYDQENKLLVDNLDIQYNQCNEPELIETTDKILTPSFYHLKLRKSDNTKKEIIIWADSYTLNYNESIDEKFEIKNQRVQELLIHFLNTNKKQVTSCYIKEVRQIIKDGEANHDEPESIIKNIASYMKQHDLKFPKKFFITGLPGIGKTTSLYYIANYFDLDVISTEILINYYIFNDDLTNTERINYEKYWKDVDLNELYGDKSLYYTQFSRKGYENLSDNSDHMKQIRDLACRIALELVEGTAGKAIVDLGGKEALTNFYYVLKQNGYKNIFITTEGTDEEEIFRHYLSLYKNDPNLCNESRRNIKKLALKEFEDGHKEIDTKSKEFEDSLNRLIFKPRYKYYRRRGDYVIVRREDDDTASTVLKILEKVFEE